MNNLRTMRLTAGISQIELAHKTHIAPQTISQIENNKIYPYPGWRRKLAKALSVKEDDIFPREWPWPDEGSLK